MSRILEIRNKKMTVFEFVPQFDYTGSTFIEKIYSKVVT